MTGPIYWRIFWWPQFMGKSHYGNLDLTTCGILDPKKLDYL